MNTRFSGRVLFDTSVHPLTPAHYSFTQGWLTAFASQNTDCRKHIAIITPIDSESLEIELYNPAAAIVSHMETVIINPEIADDNYEDDDQSFIDVIKDIQDARKEDEEDVLTHTVFGETVGES